MPVVHQNRKGKSFYLHEGRTSKGNPKYFFSAKAEGNLADQIPAGFEIHERPETAQVYLRKVKESRITPHEREFVLQECRRLAKTNAVLVDVDGDSLVVYFAEGNEEILGAIFRGSGIPTRAVQDMLEWRVTHGHYMPMLRFTLDDEAARRFSADRWCFLGSIDDWFHLESSAPLDELVRRYAKHLGKESFYELM